MALARLPAPPSAAVRSPPGRPPGPPHATRPAGGIRSPQASPALQPLGDQLGRARAAGAAASLSGSGAGWSLPRTFLGSRAGGNQGESLGSRPAGPEREHAKGTAGLGWRCWNRAPLWIASSPTWQFLCPLRPRSSVRFFVSSGLPSEMSPPARSPLAIPQWNQGSGSSEGTVESDGLSRLLLAGRKASRPTSLPFPAPRPQLWAKEILPIFRKEETRTRVQSERREAL